MEYISTRDQSENPRRYSAAQAICTGLAPDGGLFVPDHIPVMTADEFRALIPLSYPERAAEILSRYLTDYGKEELHDFCRRAYAPDRFPGGAAPTTKLGDGSYMLELWHGPTCAFKDMALQLMPYLLGAALRKTGETRTALILVATSGDTGKAALEGFADAEGIKIQVYYPENGVSAMQKAQMATQSGKNVSVVAIRGNFDDAQTGVKRLFSDAELKKELDRAGVFFSSANSINLGRLAPQIAYYVSAYCDLCACGALCYGDPLDVTVPTGNFGNILAAFYAKRMGLPLGRLVCASNENCVLTDFLQNGTYSRLRPFYTTSSPSMDILISSNLERLLFALSDAKTTAGYMKTLNETGSYTVSPALFRAITDVFSGLCANESQGADCIRETFERTGCLIDTHTAVALSCADRYRAEHADQCMLTVSTASPYKFAHDVLSALDGEPHEAGFAAVDALCEKTGAPIPAPLNSLRSKAFRFTDVTDPDSMIEHVRAFAAQKSMK